MGRSRIALQFYSVLRNDFCIYLGRFRYHKKVHEEATEITNKIETGKKLATPGIILSIVAMVLSTIVTIVLFAIGVGAAVIGSSSQSGNFTF